MTSSARYAVWVVVAAFVAWGVVDGAVALLRVGWMALASSLPVQAMVGGAAILGVAGALAKGGLVVWAVLRGAEPDDPTPSPVVLVLLILGGLLGWGLSLVAPMMTMMWTTRQLPVDQIAELSMGTAMASWLEYALTHTGLLLALGLAYWKARPGR